MKKLLVLLSVTLFAVMTLHAQTYHFSQFYSTPLLINPAATGLTQGPYRLAANYRSQWNGAGSPYTTTTISGDAHLLPGKVPEGDILGVGLVLLNDKTMDGVVQTNSAALSTAYHITLDDEHVQTIGLGFQGTYNERRVDFTRLEFENQFGNNGYDPSLPIGESFDAGKKYYFDLNLGAMYSFTQEDRSFFAGLSGYNLLKKDDSYLTEQFKTPPLFSVIAGGDIDVGVDNSFYFSGNIRQQGNSREITLGMAYGIFLDEYGYSVFKVGLWHRVQDALIPYAGFTYKGLQLGCSYDYNISGQKTRSQIKNTFEISLLYLAPDQTQLKRLIPWY